MMIENKSDFDVEQKLMVMMNNQSVCEITLLNEPQYVEEELCARFLIEQKNLIAFLIKFESGLQEQLCNNQKILYQGKLYCIESLDFGDGEDDDILLLCYLPKEVN